AIRSKSFATDQPIASVTPAAVAAFNAFPKPGTQPNSTWDTPRPTRVAALVANVASAIVRDSAMLNTVASVKIMASCIGTITAASEQGTWAIPAPAPAEAVAAMWMMVWHCAFCAAVMANSLGL
ncbi:MAG: hypothetical protein WCJ56_00360, partial [bacterium]